MFGFELAAENCFAYLKPESSSLETLGVPPLRA